MEHPNIVQATEMSKAPVPANRSTCFLTRHSCGLSPGSPPRRQALLRHPKERDIRGSGRLPGTGTRGHGAAEAQELWAENMPEGLESDLGPREGASRCAVWVHSPRARLTEITLGMMLGVWGAVLPFI